MKFYAPLLLSIIAAPTFAGGMGDAQSSPPNRTYVSIGGGYYGSNYQENYTNYSSGVLSKQESFNGSNTSGYGQVGLGASARIGSLSFDHQLSIAKLGDAVSFNTPQSTWRFSQNVDFGYDFMPKINMLQKISGYGLLGAHYARFTYQKKTSSPTSTSFNTYKDQIGFNLGAGLNYHINAKVDLGIKYQHWQYASTQVNGKNPASTSIDIEQLRPSYNLIGLELRYYLS